MVVSDIVLDKPLPKDPKDDANLYAACIAGALRRAEYLRAIGAAGFEAIEILSEKGHDGGKAGGDPITGPVGGRLKGVASSITVFARKPRRFR